MLAVCAFILLADTYVCVIICGMGSDTVCRRSHSRCPSCNFSAPAFCMLFPRPLQLLTALVNIDAVLNTNQMQCLEQNDHVTAAWQAAFLVRPVVGGEQPLWGCHVAKGGWASLGGRKGALLSMG